MADISTLIHDIEQAVYQNTGQEVTGSAVQLILKEIASTLNTMKVDAVEGKGLSTNDLTDALKSAIENAASQAQLAAGLAGKVDEEAGKGLSTNDLTDAILATIQNAVSASELATALLDYVQKEDGKGLSTNDYTNADKQKVGNALTEVPDTYRTASDQDEIDAGKESKHPYISLERLQEYLYRVTFDSLPEDNGGDSPVGGGCSAFVREGKMHRNYDFKYDNAASFIVRTKDFEGMSMITGLNDGQMDDALIAQLPYRMVDGINNNGIMVSVHLLFNDWEYTGAGSKSIPMTRLPFEVLSRVKSMATIGTDLADVLGNLAVTTGMGDYLLQCLITDGTTTYALIPPTTDGASYVLVNATSYPKMSNFRYVARAEVSRNDADLQTRPTGIERYNLMPCELSDLRFTKAYEASDRLSEFIGIDDTTKASSDAELTAIYNEARAEYLTRERDGKTWQTMHSVVYGNKMEELYIQEDWADDILGGGDYIEKPSSFTPGHLAALDSDGNLEDSETGLDISKKYGRKNGQWVEITEGGPGASDFDELNNRPKYNGTAMTHSTDIPAVPSQLSQLSGDTTHRTVTDAEKAGWDAKQDDISDLIPEQASAQNQLADKNFVNSSVQTASANFRGNWATKSAIPTDYTQYPVDYAGNKKPTTNDYLVVQADESQDGGTWRYKYSGVWDTDGVSGWNAEYEVNETPLTAAQLAALNSGITAAAVGQIAANTTAIAGKAAIIYGYLFEGVFYEESTHTTAITPSSANQYVDMTDATAPVPYIWNGSAYIATGGGGLEGAVRYDQSQTLSGVEQTQALINLGISIEDVAMYGIEFDTSVSSPTCIRIGNAGLHRRLPIHNLMRGCLLNDSGQVVEYLPETDWTNSVRDGSRGQVMVEIPAHYRKFETSGTKRRVKISMVEIPGYHLVPKQYVSAYEATVQRSVNKLASVVNNTADYRGGNNSSGWDELAKSLLGRPASFISRTNFRTYARNRGAVGKNNCGWNCMTYDIQKELYWLFVIEYATLNSQAAYNAQLTSDGYRQGGLGDGVSTFDSGAWSNFNSYNPFVPCGHTDSFGNRTGVVQYDVKNDEQTVIKSLSVPRYRGVENPFVHIWQWTDGINIQIRPDADSEPKSKVYVCSDPSMFNDSNYDGYTYVGDGDRSSGYVKSLIFGEGGEIMPEAVGGSSTTYFCDNYSTDIPSAVTLRGVSFGGNAHYGEGGGLVCADLRRAPGFTSPYFGSRLCFIP